MTTTTTTKRDKSSAPVQTSETAIALQAMAAAYANLQELESAASAKMLQDTVPLTITWATTVVTVATGVIKSVGQTVPTRGGAAAILTAALKHGVLAVGDDALAYAALTELSGRGKPKATKWSRAYRIAAWHSDAKLAAFLESYRAAGRKIDTGMYATYLQADHDGKLEDGLAPVAARTEPKVKSADDVVNDAVKALTASDAATLGNVIRKHRFDLTPFGIVPNSRGKLDAAGVAACASLATACLAMLARQDVK